MDHNDGLPNNSMYVVGLDDKSGPEPTAYTCTSIEVFKNRIAKTDKISYTCNSIDVSDLKLFKQRQERKSKEPRQEQYINLDLEDPELETQTIHSIIDRQLPENLIDIPKDQVTRILNKNKELTDQVSQILLEQGSTSLMSFDAASAYTETVLRDGLKIGAKLDTNVTVALEGILQLSIIAKYLNVFDLPKSIRTQYISKMTELVVTQNHEDMKKQVTAQRHSTLLQTLAGRIGTGRTGNDKRGENRNGLGVGRGNSGRRIQTIEPEEFRNA